MSEYIPAISETIPEWKSDETPISDQVNPKSSPLLLYKGPEHMVKGALEDMHPAFQHLEDGRMYFAVDTKKIYVDCNFTTSDGDHVQDRLSFGGNNGIFFGRKTFTEAQIEGKEYWFIFENGDLEDNRDDVPQVDDLILNTDGCFYRVVDVHLGPIEETVDDGEGGTMIVPSEELYTIIECKKLTIAGSGSGGGGGSASSDIVASLNPEQQTTFVKARNTIPISFKVTDTAESVTNLNVDIYINSQYVGTKVVRVSGEYQTLDLKQYANYFVTNSTINQIRLTFKDEYDASRSITLRNVNLVELAVVLEGQNLGRKSTTEFPVKFYPYGGSSMYSWKVKIRLNPPDSGNAVQDEMTTQADKGAEESYNVKHLDSYGEGLYTIDFWIEAYPDIDSVEPLLSPVASASFYYADENSTTVGISMMVSDSENLSQYGTATVLYTVVYAGAPKSTVHLRATCDGVDVVNTYSTVNNDINQTWLVPLDLAGTYTFSIGIDELSYSTEVTDIIVSAPLEEVPVIDKNNNSLQLYLSATGKSNDQVDRDQWTWGNITSEFEHFNWSTDGWQVDEQNQTSLRLSNGAKLKVNFAPFSAANTGGNGAQSTGKTIEFDFKLSNVRDTNGILINIASWDAFTGKIYCGIVGQGDKISINTTDLTNYRTAEEDFNLAEDIKAKTNGLRAYLAENERIHVAFVVQSISEEQNKSLIYTYINGVLSGLANYEGQLIDKYPNNPAYIVFDSTYGDIDLYNLRVYSKKFTDDEILKNYAADRPTVEEKLAVMRNNNALDNNNNISLTSVMNLGNIPYIVWTDCRKTVDKKGGYNKKDDSTWGTNITDQTPSLPTGKKDFRWCEFYYVDPEHPERNIGDINHKVTAVIYAQGTSSLDYPVKNIRLRIRETDCDGNPQDKYSILPAIPIEGLDSNDPVIKADAEAEQAKWEKVPGVRLFTFKADYMESSLAHNTGTGNVLAALYDSVGLTTPAQRYFSGKTITSHIVGRPCLGFYQAYNTSTPVFVGRYNFDTDKAEHDLFGFKEVIPVDEDTKEPDLEHTFGVATKVVDGHTQLKWGFHGTLDEKYDNSKTYYNSPSLDENQVPNDIWMENNTQEEREAAFKTRIGYKDANGKTVDGTGPALYEYQEGPSTIQCWEFLNNANALCRFGTKWIEGTSKVKNWTGAFESRYPEYYTQPATDKRGYLRFVNWLNSTYQLGTLDDNEYNYYITQDNWTPIKEACEAVDYPTKRAQLVSMQEDGLEDTAEYKALQTEVGNLITQLGENATLYDKYAVRVAACENDFPSAITYGGVNYTHDSKAYRLAKFKAEINDYMDLNMTVFYYVITETFLMIDSRAKNMMMCSYDCDMDAGTGHWFPIFYDMDTILGVDNKGILRFPYDTDDEVDAGAFNACANYGHYENGNWIENGRASALWANLREGFQTEIASMYNALRDAKKFSYDFLSKSYNDKQADAFAPIYDNKDAKYKYIDPYGSKVIIDGKASDLDANYLHAAQGTRTLHREFFLSHRFTLLDSKYPEKDNGDYLTNRADIVLRLYDTSAGSNVHPTINNNSLYYGRFQMTSQSTQYGVYKAGNGVSLTPVKLEPNVPTWTPPVPQGFSVGDQESYLYSLGDIYDLGDLSDKYPGTFDIKVKTKLRSLKFGNNDPAYKSSTVLNVMGWNNVPLLELLDIRKKNLQSNPNLLNCKYFQTLLAAGSDITNVQLPIGGNLKRLELPASMQTLIIRDHRFYDTFHDLDNEGTKAFTCEGYTALNDLWIEGCPLVDTATLVKNIRAARINQDHPNGAEITHVRLPDISWDIYPDNEWCIINDEVISDIPIVEFLSRTSYGWNAEGNNATNNTYVAGTVRIHNGTDEDENNFGVDIYALNKKYNEIFPELDFEYDENSKNITGYYINVNNLSGDKVTANAITGYQNSIVIGHDDVTGDNDTPRFNFASHMNMNVAIPVQNPDGQYTYEFKGWSVSKPDAVITQGYADADPALVAARTHIPVTINTEDPENPYMECDLDSPYLELSDFDDNLEINLYPVFLKHLRIFNVWFYMTEEGAEHPVLNPECHTYDEETQSYLPVQVQYGHPAPVPSNEPVIITLDANDKTQATIRKMIKYDDKNGQNPLNRITANCAYYPIFDLAQRMSELTSPSTSYFDTELVSGNTILQAELGLTAGEDSYAATIKESYTGEAIVVPLTIDGKKIVTLKNRSATVKRIFFEKDPDTGSSNILYFLGGFGNGFTKINDAYNAETVDQQNNTLEYVEFKACKNLKVISGGITGTDMQTHEFGGCKVLYVDELPDSIEWIGYGAFRDCPEVAITKLPDSLTYIGDYAFRKCTGLHLVDMSTFNPDPEVRTSIRLGAFQNCTNLSFGNDYYFKGWNTIGDYVFDGCSSLKAFDSASSPDDTTLTTIGDYAFYNCRNLGLVSLPKSLERIGARGLALGGNTVGQVSIGLSALSAKINFIGDRAFSGCYLTNGVSGSLVWRLSATENPQVNAHAFTGLVCQRIRFADWGSPDAVYADYDEERDPKWMLAKVAPWYSTDTEEYLLPFGAVVAVNGAPTPYSIDANN